MNPKVSVVVPCHDHGHLLGDALDSVAAQGLDSVEVIVVDDQSSDDTIAVATERGAQVIPSRGSGAAAARNTGAAAARGDLIAFLDADDVWPERSLAIRVAALDGSGDDAVAGAVEEFVDPRNVSPSPEPRRASFARVPGSLIITRRAWVAVGPINESLAAGEFIDWVARFDSAGLHVARVEEVVLRRRIHDTNSTRRPAADISGGLLAVARLHRNRGRM